MKLSQSLSLLAAIAALMEVSMNAIAQEESMEASEKRPAASRDALFRGSCHMKKELLGVHPRLYVDSQELASAKERFKKEPEFLSDLKESSLKFMELEPYKLGSDDSAFRPAVGLARLSALYRIGGDPAFLKGIEAWRPVMDSFAPLKKKGGMNNDLISGSLLYNFAVVYDLLKGSVSPELEASVRNVLLKQARSSYEDLSRYKSYHYEQNHLIIPVCGLAIAALALMDEPDVGKEAEAWLVFSRNLLDRSFDAVARDGWFFEGISYWDFTMTYPLAYAGAMRRVVGEDLFKKPLFKNAGLYLSHMLLPDPEFAFDFGDWGPRVDPRGGKAQPGYELPWHALKTPVRNLRALCHELDDPVLNGIARSLSLEGCGKDALCALWQFDARTKPVFKPGDPARPLPYHYFDDMEVLHWRSSWDDPSATAIAFKSGPPGGHHIGSLYSLYPEWTPGLGHSHPDAGSFILFAKGSFLANDTGYCRKSSSWHNTLLVDGKGQEGRTGGWDWYADFPYGRLDKLRLENVWLASNVVAASAVFEDAYPESMKLQKARRHLILVDGRFGAIFDEVEAEGPHVYSWLLHGDKEAKGSKDGVWTMENGQARLALKSFGQIASAKAAPTVVETNVYLDAAGERPRPQERGHHIEITSPSSKGWSLLTAFAVQASGAGSFSATARSGRSVEIFDGDDSCRIWIGEQEGLSGSFAFLVKKGGRLASLGFSGKGFVTEAGSFSAPSGAQAVLRPSGEGASWSVEGSSVKDIEVRR